MLIGVSGGADSLALLYALHELRSQLDCHLHIAHLDHDLRPDSVEDAEFVRQHANHLNLPISIDRVDVLHLKQQQKLSVETAARKARYRFYEAVSKRIGATKIALGHHRKDQAETILMNLLRGAAITGLKGMLPVRDGKFIRPLLDVSREEIEEFVVQLGLHPRQDSTNFDRAYLRNRIRLELLPLLECDYNPNLQNTLAQTAELLRADSDYLENVTSEAFETCRMNINLPDAVVLERTTFGQYHLALRRRILRFAIAEMSGEPAGLSFHHLESMLRLIESESPNGSLALPDGLEFRRAYNHLIFRVAVADIGDFEYEIAVPGTTSLPLLNAEIVASIIEKSCATENIVQIPDGKFQAIVDFDCLRFPLKIRNRRKGDRFQPFGMVGSKKIKDFLIDAKVPGHERGRTPILVSGNQILWVVGHRTSGQCKVDQTTKRYLYLTYSNQS